MEQKRLIYHSGSGELYFFDGSAKALLSGFCWSGRKRGRNNPDMDHVANLGPIPRGFYRVGKPFAHPTCGSYVLRLSPEEGTNTHGRDGFLIHGASKNPFKFRQESQGCIIASRLVRERIVLLGASRLEVVA